MGVTRTLDGAGRADARAEAVIWHDLECGGYSADLALWRELAGTRRPAGRGPVLDVGVGHRAGRARARARRAPGDRARARRRRCSRRCASAPAGLAVERSARTRATSSSGRARLALCVVPMQTIHLLGGPPGARVPLAACARAARRARCSRALLVTELRRVRLAGRETRPEPETAIARRAPLPQPPADGAARAETIVIVRRRERLDPHAGARDPDAEPVLDVIELDASTRDARSARAGPRASRARAGGRCADRRARRAANRDAACLSERPCACARSTPT